MEINNPASRGVANSALGLGIAGTALGILNGGLGNILNTGTCGCATTRTVGCGCNEDHYVDRYEAAQSAEIARLNTELKLRDANTYTMGEMGKLRDYVDGRFSAIEQQICAQNVYNATNNATIGCISGQVAQLMSLTQINIPAAKVCPQPMPQYNSWTAPTTTAAAAG